MKKLTTLSLLVSASVALSVPAFADTVGGSDDGFADLVLSFRVDDSAGTGSYSDLEVNLGAAANYDVNSGTTGTVSLGQLNFNDLSSTFGSNYNTRGDLVFSAAGVGQADNANTDAYVTESGKPQLDTSSFSAASTSIESVDRYLSGQTTTGDSAYSAVIGTAAAAASTLNGSYSYYEYQGTTTKAYGYFVDGGTANTNISDIEHLVTAGNDYLNLYYYDGGDGPTLEGYFDLNTTSDTLTYTYGDAAPTPEPSTWALLLGGAGLLGLAVRRRWISFLG